MLNMKTKADIDIPIGDYAAVEAALLQSPVTIGQLCVAVPMARSTWQRWKSGATGGPTVRQWQRVLGALVEVIARPEEDTA